MQTSAAPFVQDLVLIGGGHAHALVLRSWAMRPMPGVRLTVINPGPAAPYTGMLPGQVAGHYSRAAMMIDLVRLARMADARLILDTATGLDLDQAQVHLAGRAPIRFDRASLDIGIGSGLPDLPGFAEHAVAAKPLGAYAEAWERFVALAPAKPRVVVIGAGIGGVELALAMRHRLQQAGATPSMTLVDTTRDILRNIGSRAQKILLAELAQADVSLCLGQPVAKITANTVILQDHTELASDFTVSVAGARPQGWLTEAGLALQEGFVTVGPTLQTSDPRVFAVGDCAHLSHAPRPKAGVFAVRAAPILDHNLRTALAGHGQLRPYHPQRDYLKLVSLGDRRALADKFGFAIKAPWIWRWKDRIDTRFMTMLTTEMPRPVVKVPADAAAGLAILLAETPPCGACGAKLPRQALTSALAGLPPPIRPEVLSGPGDDAAILARPAGGVRVITTDHLRGFTHDYRRMARVTANHALGDIWAMGALPEVAMAQVTFPRMAAALQAEALAEIMAEATAFFRAAGADIVGGHSSQGAELTLGFTVTGLCDRPVRKGGVRPGDVLILTKPIGTGVILAAEMAAARLPDALLGEVWTTCMAGMERSLEPAARLIGPVARAMTDVTGFGLAGHLAEMLAASDPATAKLVLHDIPCYSGAIALVGLGHQSSLAPANRTALADMLSAPQTARAALLYDPQTCGGLLAAVPEDLAQDVLTALSNAGEPATVIGRITEGPRRIDVI